jgi:hypothetical protein
MVWGAFANAIPTLPDFAGEGFRLLVGGSISKERKNAIHDMRFLRRREYQDQMYSMREAGLNPILAAGATPGHSAVSTTNSQMGTSQSAGIGSSLASAASARAANRQAGVREKLLPFEQDLVEANVSTAQAGAREKEALAAIAELTLYDQQDRIRAAAESDRASAGLSTARQHLVEGPETRLTEAREQLAKSERLLRDVQSRVAQVITPAQVAQLMGAARLAASTTDLNKQNAARLQYQNVVNKIEADLRKTGVGENSLKFKMIMRDIYDAFAPFMGENTEREESSTTETIKTPRGRKTRTLKRSGVRR